MTLKVVKDRFPCDGVLRPVPPSEAHVWVQDAWVLDPDKAAAVVKGQREQAYARINQYHSEVVQRLVDNPTQTEKDTWTLKLETAESILSGTAISAVSEAFLVGAGMTTVDARATWADKVLTNAAAYAKAAGVAESIRSNARQSIQDAADAEAIGIALAHAVAAFNI